jgi:hypothetical protein
LALIERAAAKSGIANVLTHCNAGWLATVDVGTATAPIYLAQRRGIPVHVWVDETRPRNQGAALTAWELGRAGVAHTVIVDNAGGHLMQRGRVDLCIVGTDRTARSGDVANKIGTYLKALAAHDNGIPFYVAAPSSSIDWRIRDGLREIPIEERSAEEVSAIEGLHRGHVQRVRLTPLDSPRSQPGLRRDSGAPRDGADHGARGVRGERVGFAGIVSGARRRCTMRASVKFAARGSRSRPAGLGASRRWRRGASGCTRTGSSATTWRRASVTGISACAIPSRARSS